MGPTLSSARMDFPAVMTLAAERVGLPLPPPLPPRPVNRLRSGVYGPVHPAQPTFVSPQLPEVWRCVEATWQQPFKTKASIILACWRLPDHPQADAPALPSQDESDYSDHAVSQMSNLIYGVATAAGRMISLATVASRHVRPGLTALSKKGSPRSPRVHGGALWVGLLGHPVSRLEEKRVQLSRMLSLASHQAPLRAPFACHAEEGA